MNQVDVADEVDEYDDVYEYDDDVEHKQLLLQWLTVMLTWLKKIMNKIETKTNKPVRFISIQSFSLRSVFQCITHHYWINKN